MKERPILFNSEMVRAILEGRKTQTRRVLGIDPCVDRWEMYDTDKGYWGAVFDKPELRSPESILHTGITELQKRKCPYGKPGDQLWVRETFAYITDSFAISQGIRYKADEKDSFIKSDVNLIPEGSTVFNSLSRDYPDIVKYRPSIHMPRWASRIQLEITDVRVERVQDISERDMVAEGIALKHSDYEWYKRDRYSQDQFFGFDLGQRWVDLWSSINDKRGFGWDVNPWVWVVEFRVIENA